MVRVLISEHRANMYARNFEDDTPLNKAALGGQSDTIKTTFGGVWL